MCVPPASFRCSHDLLSLHYSTSNDFLQAADEVVVMDAMNAALAKLELTSFDDVFLDTGTGSLVDNLEGFFEHFAEHVAESLVASTLRNTDLRGTLLPDVRTSLASVCCLS